jgi:hypothetical protein
LQRKPQFAPSQVEVELTGGVQGVHEVPQAEVLVLLGQEFPPQAWNPLPQATPHIVPSQVGVPFAGVGHAVHEEPQLLNDELATQAVSELPLVVAQRW